MTEEEGIKAIIYLQAMADLKITEEEAKKIWNSFGEPEKKQTIYMYNLFSKDGTI